MCFQQRACRTLLPFSNIAFDSCSMAQQLKGLHLQSRAVANALVGPTPPVGTCQTEAMLGCVQSVCSKLADNLRACPCCCSFGLVAIPMEMRVYLAIGSLAVICLSFMWEHTLRQLFPAAKPPSKGYMVHQRELRAVNAKQERSKKDL